MKGTKVSKLRIAVFVLVIIALAGTQVFAQSAAEVQALRKEVESLKAGQTEIQSGTAVAAIAALSVRQAPWIGGSFSGH